MCSHATILFFSTVEYMLLGDHVDILQVRIRASKRQNHGRVEKLAFNFGGVYIKSWR